MPAPWRSALAVSGVVLPLGSYVGISERLDELDKIDVRRSLNGTAVVFRPLWGTKYKLDLTASGTAVRWGPAFAHLRKGDVVDVHAISFLGQPISPGQTTVQLVRPAVDGSIRVHRASDGGKVAFAYDPVTQILTLASAQAEDVVVQFRPSLRTVLVSRGLSRAEIDGTMGWSLGFEET